MQAFEGKFKALLTELLAVRTASAVGVALVNEKTGLAHDAKLTIKDKLSNLRTEIEFYWHESKKKLYDMTTSDNKWQMRLPSSEKNLVQYYVENRELSSRVDGLEIEETSFHCKLSGLQYDYDSAWGY